MAINIDKQLVFLFIMMMVLPGITLYGQEFKVDTIQYNGDLEKIINLVILPDGYTEGEMRKFHDDSRKLINELFSQRPFLEYKNYFNVFSILSPSIATGASHPATASDVNEPVFPKATVNNRFGSTFDFAQIHRLLVPTRTFAINNVLAQNFPLYDQVLMLVNTPHYGGSGGFIATTSLNTNASEIAIHEIGHSFADLADEYYAGDQYARESANMTRTTDPETVRWKNWYGEESIGIYQHCCDGISNLWYRPHNNCKMRFLDRPFCAVCVQEIVETIHRLSNPIESIYPKEEIIDDDFPLMLTIHSIKPEPNTLKTTWYLNDEVIAINSDTIIIDEKLIPEGLATIRFTMEDTTDMLRVNDHAEIHTLQVIWEVNRSTTSVELINNALYDIQINPNPTYDYVAIRFLESPKQNYEISLFDLSGNLHQKFRFFENNTRINLQNLPPGPYLLNIRAENQLIFSKKIYKF